MTARTDGRPGEWEHWFRPGSPVPATLTGWPAGSLVGRTFTSTAGSTPLAVAVVGDELLVTATSDDTLAIGEGAHDWDLTETTSGDPVPRAIGTWVGSYDAAETDATTVPIAVGDITIQVQVPGGGDVAVVEGRVDQLELDTAALDSRLDAAEGTVTGLDTRVDAAEGTLVTHTADIAALTTADGTLDTRLDGAEANVTALQAADGVLDGRLDTAEGGLTSLSGRVTTAEADITAVESGVAALGTRTTLESIGAAADQTAARAMEQRWIALARECGSASGAAPRKPELKYMGGDVLDVMQLPGGTQKLWVCADIWAGATVQSDDTYSGPALPTRNACIQEVPAGTFGTMLYDVGTSGVWLDAVADGGQPADHIWWPTCVLDDGGATLMRVGCVLIGPPDAENPFGVYAGSQIVTLNAFGLFSSVTDVTSADLQIDGFLKDTTHTYIFGEEHVGFVDEETLGSKITKVARVVNGSLLTLASWEYWDGAGWSASPAAAVPLRDVDGVDLLGDACVAKIATDHYLMASHSLSIDPWLDTYRSAAPIGPWEKIARTPLPGIGQSVAGGTLIAQIPRILATNCLGNPDERPPAGRSLVMLSRNVLGATAAMADQSIFNFLPMFAVVPNQ